MAQEDIDKIKAPLLTTIRDLKEKLSTLKKQNSELKVINAFLSKEADISPAVAKIMVQEN